MEGRKENNGVREGGRKGGIDVETGREREG